MIGARVSETGGAWRGWTLRFPWLLCNIAGGLIAAFIAARHSALLETVVALALFMPVVLALSESVGMQAVTLTLQRLHGAAGGLPAFAKSLRREGLTGLLLGASCGAMIGGVVWIFERRPELAGVVATTVMASMTTSAVAGVALPAGLRALRWNPRVAAGPIVLAIADFGTLLIYFALAGLWLT
jgi:magnesium transporter